MSIEETDKHSTSESKTTSELLQQIAELKAENQSLNKRDDEGREQKSRRVYQSIVDMLANPGFSEAYESVLNDIERDIFNTEAGEAEKREHLYWQAQGMQKILLRLKHIVKSVQQVKPNTQLG